jgi:hypothetical protein
MQIYLLNPALILRNYNNTIYIGYNDYTKGLGGVYNNPLVSPTDVADTWYQNGKINVTAQWSTVAAAHDNVTNISGNTQLSSLFVTVENVQNGLGVHEFFYHGIMHLDNNDHHEIFYNQMMHSSWQNTTPAFKNYIYDSYYGK